MHLVAKRTNHWISYCKDVLKAFYIGRSSDRDSDARSPRMIRRVYASSDIASRRLRAELAFCYGKVTGKLRRKIFTFDCCSRGSYYEEASRGTGAGDGAVYTLVSFFVLNYAENVSTL